MQNLLLAPTPGPWPGPLPLLRAQRPLTLPHFATGSEMNVSQALSLAAAGTYIPLDAGYKPK